MIRGVYPALKGLEGPLGPIGMGKAGRAALPGVDDKDKARRESEAKAGSPGYVAWREKYLEDRKGSPRSRKRKQRNATK
jgi:hypothetical protein